MITSIKEWKRFNESILVPRNIEGRKDKLRQDRIKLLSQEVIEGYLEIDKTFEGIPLELIKVKEIKGDVRISIFLNKIPVWLKDVKIYGSFDITSCFMSDLENSPQYVGGDFYCSYNDLTSLKGLPKYIGGDLYTDIDFDLTLPNETILKGNIL